MADFRTKKHSFYVHKRLHLYMNELVEQKSQIALKKSYSLPGNYNQKNNARKMVVYPLKYMLHEFYNF